LIVGSFTGAAGLSPRTGYGKVFVSAWMAWVLIMTSAYTANLASLLVAKSSISPKITSLEQAVQEKATVCTVRGLLGEKLVRQKYANLKVLRTDDSKMLYDKLNAKECAAGIAEHDFWNAASMTHQANPNCNLEGIRAPFKPVRASFAFPTNRAKCHEHLADIVNAHLFDMDYDGFIDGLKSGIEEQMDDLHCPLVKPEPSGVLHLVDLSGAFLLPLMVSMALIMLDMRNRKAGTPLLGPGEEESFPLASEKDDSGTEVVGLQPL